MLTMAHAAPGSTAAVLQRGEPVVAARGGKPAQAPVGFFALSEVDLLAGGPFESARAIGVRELLSLDADRLLHEFRTEAGLPPKLFAGLGSSPGEARANGPCAGYLLGRYLSACSLTWAATREAPLRQRADHVVNELRACQHAAGGGWAGAFSGADTPTRHSLATVLALNRAPWHGVQKLLAGLRDAHLHARLPRALPVLARLADGIEDAVQACGDNRVLAMLPQANGGVAEMLADLFALTGQRRYLRLAERFSDRALLDALAQGRGLPAGPHVATRIPELIALARLHELTGQNRDHPALRPFWRDGSVSGPVSCDGLGDDCFAAGDALRHPTQAVGRLPGHADDLLRLTRLLFAADPLAAYADCQERVLFNAALASPDPCVGSADSIYAHQGDILYVNQFIASRLDWSAKRVQLRQDTMFPDDATTRLSISCARRTRFTMRLRHPAWCRQLGVAINGRRFLDSEVAGRFVEIERNWCDGDTVDVQLPMHPYTRSIPGAAGSVACMVGPVMRAPWRHVPFS